MPTMSLVVGGMRCRRCVREVSARLRDVPGVETVTADAERSRVRLTGTMAAVDVLESLRGLGYPVQVLDELSGGSDDRRVRPDSGGTATGQPSS